VANRKLQASVCISGAGPGGVACAATLAGLGVDVLLIGAPPRNRPTLAETCGPAVARWLPPGFEFHRHCARHTAISFIHSAWGTTELDARDLRFWHGADSMVLDRANFDAWLVGSAESAGVRVVRNAVASSARCGSGHWTVSVEQEGRRREVEAAYFIEAGGRSARAIAYPDANRIYSDGLICISAEWAGAETCPRALVESSRDGWWFTAVVPGAKRVLCYFTDADLVPATVPRAELLKAVIAGTEHVRQICREDIFDAVISVSDARTSIRRLLWRGTWLPIGDAAFAMDPLSGNGIERAVRDGNDAAHAVAAALGGSSDSLREFAGRKADRYRELRDRGREYYRVESRFDYSLFWQRRR